MVHGGLVVLLLLLVTSLILHLRQVRAGRSRPLATGADGRFVGLVAAFAWASWICLKTLPMPGRIRSRRWASASRSRRLARAPRAGRDVAVVVRIGHCRILIQP
jgi:hypothetical protein